MKRGKAVRATALRRERHPERGRDPGGTFRLDRERKRESA
jgi:hypothetical protein